MQLKAGKDTLNRPQAMAEFSENLLSYEKAVQYLEGRGLQKRLITAGEIGFCPPYTLYRSTLLKGRIVVPIRSVCGDIVALAGRIYEPMRSATIKVFWEQFSPGDAQKRIDAWSKGKWVNEVYVKSRHLYHLYEGKNAIREQNFAIVVEGYFDALVLAEYGFNNVVATCGVALSSYHAALLARYTDRVVLMLDGDIRGAEAVKGMAAALSSAGIASRVLVLPEKCDPDELVLKTGSKFLHKALGMLLQKDPGGSLKLTA